MAASSWSTVKVKKFGVGDADPVTTQAAITAATSTYDEDVINAIIAVLVAFGLVEEE